MAWRNDIITAALMWLVSRAGPAFGLLLPARRALALGLIVAGAVISALGVVSFRRAGTTVNPIKPETAGSLVVSGIYRRTRNPMYLGFLPKPDSGAQALALNDAVGDSVYHGCTRIDTDAYGDGRAAFDPPNRESFSNAVCLIPTLESVCIRVYPWFYTAWFRL